MISVSLLAATVFAAAIQDYGYSAPAPPPPPRMDAPRQETQQPAKPAAQLVIPTSPPGRALKDLPNATIRYYDVAGKNLKEVVKFLTEQRPKDADGKPRTAATNWSVKTEYGRQTDGKGGCKIVSAKATITATAELPRLPDERAFRKQDLHNWRAFAGGLETAAASKLWFVNDHIGEVEKAMLAASCETVEAASSAAIQQIRTRSNQLGAPPAAAAAAAAPRPTN